MLCLANSERIKFTPYVHMVFEVGDLKQASPATVSRCGKRKFYSSVSFKFCLFDDNLIIFDFRYGLS